MAKKTAAPVDPNAALAEAAKTGNEREVMRILDAGTDLDVVMHPAVGMTPLDYAIVYEHPDLAAKLIARGAKRSPMSWKALRASSPSFLFDFVGPPTDPTKLSDLSSWERAPAGRKVLVQEWLKRGLVLTQATLYWMMVGMNRADEAEMTWAIDLHVEAGVKLDPDAEPADQSGCSLMAMAIEDCSLGIMKRFLELGGTIKPGQKVASSVEDGAAKKKWLAANKPRGKAKAGLELFAHLSDDELTDDVIVETLIGETDVFPDREKWLTATWEENAGDARAHRLDPTYSGDGLRWEFFVNSEEDFSAAEAQAKALYNRLYTGLTRLYGKAKKGKTHTDWPAGILLELTTSGENPYGPFDDHWAGVALRIDAT